MRDTLVTHYWRLIVSTNKVEQIAFGKEHGAHNVALRTETPHFVLERGRALERVNEWNKPPIGYFKQRQYVYWID